MTVARPTWWLVIALLCGCATFWPGWEAWCERNPCSDRCLPPGVATGPDSAPGRVESCNGLDDDCDGEVDEDAQDAATHFADADEDGWGVSEDTVVSCQTPPGYATRGGDCDDGDFGVSPNAAEVCGDGVDNDCSGDAAGCLFDGVVFDYEAASSIFGVSRDKAGWDVALPGDIDGDGNPELLIGALDSEYTDVGAGTAYIVWGPIPAVANLGAVVGVSSLWGAAAGDAAGGSVAAAGDVYGDGHPDVLVGAFKTDTAGMDAGTVYLLDMAGPINTTLGGLTTDIHGSVPGDRLGEDLWGGDDLDGDAIPDLLVAGGGRDAPGTGTGNAGIAYLIPLPPGSSDAETAASLVVERGAAEGWLGYVSGGGDLDGDGVRDAVFGAPANSGTSTIAVFSGADVGMVDLQAGWMVLTNPTRPGDFAGSAMAVVADMTGDGLDDLLIGAQNDSEVDSTAGAAWLVPGGLAGDLDLEAAATTRWTGEASGDLAGFSVAGAGELTEDDLEDALIGAMRAGAAGSSGYGATYLVSGADRGVVPLADAVARFEATTGSTASSFGLSVAGGADFDSDGFADVVVGAPYNDASGPGAGAVYLFQVPGP